MRTLLRIRPAAGEQLLVFLERLLWKIKSVGGTSALLIRCLLPPPRTTVRPSSNILFAIGTPKARKYIAILAKDPDYRVAFEAKPYLAFAAPAASTSAEQRNLFEAESNPSTCYLNYRVTQSYKYLTVISI